MLFGDFESFLILFFELNFEFLDFEFHLIDEFRIFGKLDG
jgi:hypothetical protein